MQGTDLELVLAAFLVDIYRFHNECPHLDCKNKTGLCPALRSLVFSKLNDLNVVKGIKDSSKDSNFFDEKHLNCAGPAQSKEFMNALEILSSNKELFLKLLQDPDSQVLEKIQSLNKGKECIKDSNLINSVTSSKEQQKGFFKKKDRSTGKEKEKSEGKIVNSPPLSRIVILKPKVTTKPISSYDERAVSNFSFGEIKKRLRQIIGESRKDRELVSVNGTIVRNQSYIDGPVKSFTSKSNLREAETKSRVGSSFYKEAKRHLTEMLNSENQVDNLPNLHDLKPLSKILSLEETKIIEREGDGTEIVTQIENLESINGIEEQAIELKSENADTEALEGTCTGEETITDGKSDIEEVKGDKSMERTCLDFSLETECNKCDILGETLDLKGSIIPETEEQQESNQLIIEPIEESIPTILNSIESTTEKQELNDSEMVSEIEPSNSCSSIESCSEKPELHHSPVSVLQPFCSEDNLSPDCETVNHAGLQEITPVQLDFSYAEKTLLEDEDARSAYVNLVLEFSGLTKSESMERWYSADELLDSSLFDQLESEFNQDEDSKLLFDLTNEILIEIQERYFRFRPSVEHIKRNILPQPIGNKLLHEVNRGLDSKVQNEYEFTLEQTVKRDVESGDWMNLREESEDLVTEIWDELLDDLLEECVFDLWL